MVPSINHMPIYICSEFTNQYQNHDYNNIANNSIQSESFFTRLVPMITDALQQNLELAISQTISTAITTSMTDMQNIITNEQILLSNQQRTIEGLSNKTKQLDEIIESQNENTKLPVEHN